MNKIFLGIFLAAFGPTMTANSFAGSPPPAPTDLSAAAGNGRVGLNWSPSKGATYYNVKRSTSSGGPYKIIVSPVGTSYIDTYPIFNNMDYYYVVSAVNSAGESPNSSEVYARPSDTPPAPTVPPKVPILNIYMSPFGPSPSGNDPTHLNWGTCVGATSYNVKRSTVNGGPYKIIATVADDGVHVGGLYYSYTDYSVSKNTYYYYVVSAVNSAGQSVNSNQVYSKPVLAPTNLSATPGNAQVALSWEASIGATSYILQRATVSGGPYTSIANSVANTTYTDTTVTNNTTYYYVVLAYNGSSLSPYSTQVSATPTAPPSKGTGTSTTGTTTTPKDNSVNNAINTAKSYVKNNPDGSQTLTGHMPLEVKNFIATYKYHTSQNISAQVILPLANQSQLSTLLQNLYDPTNPGFHQFLTPAQFAQQFAPSTIDSTQVQEFLNKEGISVTGQSSDGAVLNVTGPVSAFEHAFGLHINNYQKADGTMFFAPDADPTIPATLAGKILAIGGLDNLAKYKAHIQVSANAVPKGDSGPGGFLAPNDVKTAYNLNSVPSNGSGQNVALFELDGYSSNDITAYESNFGLPNVPLQNILIDGFNGVPNYGTNGGAAEVTLDIEVVAAFAPGSSDIFVYEAPNTTQSWIDEWNKIAADDKAKVISCSWGLPEKDSATLNFDNSIFQQMAAQGQAVFVAAAVIH